MRVWVDGCDGCLSEPASTHARCIRNIASAELRTPVDADSLCLCELHGLDGGFVRLYAWRSTSVYVYSGSKFYMHTFARFLQALMGRRPPSNVVPVLRVSERPENERRTESET